MGVELMPLRVRATSPVYCGRCGKPRGLVHTCIVRRAHGRTKIKSPDVSVFTCGRCGQSYTNPLTHDCPSKPGDFKRRKAAAERADRKRKADQLRQRRREESARRRAQGAPQRSTQHRYDICRDPDCQRALCRAYREGVERGFEAGREAGKAG
jgi:hypothetical protein